VYDIDKSTIAGTATADISAIDSINKLWYQTWWENNQYQGLVTASAVIEKDISNVDWEAIYAGGYTQDGAYSYLYDGNLSLNKGDMYRMTWEGTWYHGGIDGGGFRISYDDTEKEIFWKDGNANTAINGNIAYTPTDVNPKPYKFVMNVSYLGAVPTMTMDVYDIDKTTLIGTINVDLSEFDSIKKIYYRAWSEGNIGYSKLTTASFLIEAPVNPADTASFVTLAKSDGTRTDHGTGTVQYFDLFSGNLSASENEKYVLTWNVNMLKGGGVSNGDFIIADDDSSVTLFSKAKDSNDLGGFSFATLEDSGNPDSFVAEIKLNFENNIAIIKFYDNTAKTLYLGTKYVSLDGIDSVKSVYYKVGDVSNIYGWPQNGSTFTIKGVDKTQWTEIYSGEQSKDGNKAILFDGNVPVESGDRYRFTWTGKWYNGSIPGSKVMIEDADTSIELFWKGNSVAGTYQDSTNKINDTYEYSASNPADFKFVMTFDFNEVNPMAIIDVYDIDGTTILGTITKSIAGIDSIQKIYNQSWSGTVDQYMLPINSSIVIEQDAATIEEVVEKIALISATNPGPIVFVDMEITAGEKDVPYALIAAYYSGQRLVYTDIASDTVVAGNTLEDYTFNVPAEVQGNYDKVVIYLWDGVENIKPYVAPVIAK